MGFFSDLFSGNSTATSNNNNNNNYNSYLEASGVGNQIANDQINNLVNNQQDLKDKPGVVTVNPKFNDFIERNTVNGVPNSAAQAIINQYDTGTNAYQQAMNNIIQSSPQGAAAYANQFPISNALMNAGPAIAGGGLFPGGGLIMSAFNKAKEAGSGFLNNTGVGSVIDQGMDFIQDNFMSSGSITEKPEEVDEFRNYLNNLQGLNAAAGSGISPLLDTPASAVNPINRDGPIQRDPTQITVDDVSQQGLDAFFGGQSQTDSFEDFDKRIPPKKTTQDYIDEFNEQFNLDEKKEIFGIEGKEIITPGGVEVSDSITSGITPFNQKSFSEKLEMAPTVYQKLYERMSGEMNMTDAEIEKNLRRIGSSPSNMFPYFPFKSGGITRL